MGDSGGSSETKAVVPKELKPLMQRTGRHVSIVQRKLFEQKGKGLLKTRPRGVARLSGYERGAMRAIPGMGKATKGEAMAMKYAPGVARRAGRTPEMTTEELMAAPNVQAGQAAFEATAMPTIQNQMNLAGLGDSTATANALSMANADMLSPLFAEEIARKERGIERGAEAGGAAVSQLAGLGQQEGGRKMAAIMAMLEAGGTERGIRDAKFGEQANERDRLVAMLSESLYTPLGAIAPGMVGQVTKTDGK